MKNRILSLIIVLITAFCCFPAAAYADTDESAITVRVGYFTMENFMEGGADGLPQTGFSYDLLCEMASYNHWKYEFVYGDFYDLYEQLEEGKIDLLPNVINTPEREKEVLFYDVPLNEEHYFISTRKNSEYDEDFDISMLNGRKIATVVGAYESVMFDEWAKGKHIKMEKVESPSFDGAWDLVRSGEADFILNVNNSVPDSNFLPLVEIGQHGVYFAVAKKRADILKGIDSAMKNIENISPFLINDLKQTYLSNELSSYQLTDDEKKWLEENSVLRIGALKDDVPYAYKDSNGKVVGAYPEITELIFQKLFIDGIDIRWSMYDSVDELRTALKNGEIDLMCPEYHSYYEADQNGLLISETVCEVTMGILSPKSGSSASVRTIAAGSFRPGVSYAKENFPDSEVVLCDSVDDIVKAVEDGKADGAVAHIYALQEATRYSEEEYVISPLSVPCNICFASLQENHELIMLINRGCHFISKSERNAIELRYATDSDDTETALDFIRRHKLELLLVLLAIAAIGTFAINRTVTSQKLKKSLDRITKQNEIIEASREELETANENAQAASRAKSTFLFNMSHDIRTPMNAIIGFNNMALSHIDDREKVTDCLQKVSSSSRHLLALINDVLDMARIESGKVTSECVPMCISEDAHELVEILKETAQKPLTIETDFTGVTHDHVLADSVHLNRILTNIVSNAVKYTPEGGRIRFAITENPAERKDENSYCFIVEDNGIGMSEEFVKHIFEEFSREQSSTLSGVQGTGLGMAITKRLVDMLGGTINIKSESGKGTKVTICLDMTELDRESAAKFSQQNESEAVSLNGKRVLFTEDNALNREITIDILEECGAIIDVAENGAQAVEKCAAAAENWSEKGYDVVLMDIQMPVMDGYEATRRIRAMEDRDASSVPIIAMTANAFDEDRRAALEAGMDEHIPKPVDVKKLIEALSRFI